MGKKTLMALCALALAALAAGLAASTLSYRAKLERTRGKLVKAEASLGELDYKAGLLSKRLKELDARFAVKPLSAVDALPPRAFQDSCAPRQGQIDVDGAFKSIFPKGVEGMPSDSILPAILSFMESEAAKSGSKERLLVSADGRTLLDRDAALFKALCWKAGIPARTLLSWNLSEKSLAALCQTRRDGEWHEALRLPKGTPAQSPGTLAQTEDSTLSLPFKASMKGGRIEFISADAPSFAIPLGGAYAHCVELDSCPAALSLEYRFASGSPKDCGLQALPLDLSKVEEPVFKNSECSLKVRPHEGKALLLLFAEKAMLAKAAWASPSE